MSQIPSRSLAWTKIENFIRHQPLIIPSTDEEEYALVYQHYLTLLDSSHSDSSQPILRVSSSFILQSPERELQTISDLLGLPEINRGMMIEIFGWLNLLDNDLDLFDLLPVDILWNIGSELDLQSLSFFSRISRTLHDRWGDNLTTLMRDKVQELVRLNLTSCPQEEVRFIYLVHQAKNRLAAGGSHSLVLTKENRVFGFGDNVYGQLRANENLGADNSVFVELSQSFRSNQVVSATAGLGHSLFLTSLGQVLGTGNNSCGQLGCYDIIVKTGPVLLEKTGYGNLTGIITMMAVGSDHSLLLNSEGQVFSFGSGIKGRLGHGDQDIRFIPTKIESLERTGKIVSLAAGGSHSLVLNEEGQVFSFGGNDRGQLGLGDTINRLLPELLSITGLRRVVAISAGHIHSLFLDIQGQVFGCGCHKSGQLGHKKNKIVPTLINLTHLDSPKIIAISAGYNHSLLLSAKGQVFSFGSNISGQLGLGLSSNILRCTHLPTLMTYFQTRRIISISAGRGFSLFLDDQGEYFGVGSNSLGELGCHVTCDFVTPILINSIP